MAAASCRGSATESNMNFARRLGSVLVLLVLCAASAAAHVGDPVVMAIESQLTTLMNPEVTTVRGARVAMTGRIHQFYARRGFRPAWSTPQLAAQLRQAFADSHHDGLDPADYHLPLLQQLANEVALPGATAALHAQNDILLTDGLLRLGYHLSFGKVDPESFDPQWNFGRTLASMDVVEQIEEAIASGHIYERIEALKPQHPMYLALKRELMRYRAFESTEQWAPFPQGPTIKPGMSDARVPELRRRMIVSGDLPANAGSDSSEFDTELSAAVRRYQERTGLEPDGAVGPGTVKEINVPIADRVRQLRINLDRGRVLLQDLPAEFVVVNIAGFTVYFVRGNEIVWTSRAQVGRPYRRTPIFRSEISYLVWNPTWTVPPGIIANDILPAARRDPEAITRKGLKVIDASGREVSPSSVDWSRYKSGNIPYTLRQDPGPSNALGRVKIMFPNPYLVYLHDTPSQSLFERAERAFSSGCVRVERALELAQLVLNDPARWNDQSVDAVIKGGQLQNVTLRKKIPVLLAYWTAWVDPQGRMNFRHDLYGQDARWATALDADFKVRARPLFSEASPAP